MPQDINALLAALKSKEGSSGFPPDDEPDDAAPDQSMSDDAEDSPEDSAEDNAKVVGLLQDQYPTIYAKLMKQVEADPSDDASTSGDDADMSSMSDMMH